MVPTIHWVTHAENLAVPFMAFSLLSPVAWIADSLPVAAPHYLLLVQKFKFMYGVQLKSTVPLQIGAAT